MQRKNCLLLRWGPFPVSSCCSGYRINTRAQGSRVLQSKVRITRLELRLNFFEGNKISSETLHLADRAGASFFLWPMLLLLWSKSVSMFHRKAYEMLTTQDHMYQTLWEISWHCDPPYCKIFQSQAMVRLLWLGAMQTQAATRREMRCQTIVTSVKRPGSPPPRYSPPEEHNSFAQKTRSERSKTCQWPAIGKMAQEGGHCLDTWSTHLLMVTFNFCELTHFLPV